MSTDLGPVATAATSSLEAPRIGAAGSRIVLLASLGGALEFYDFVIFGIFAKDIADAIFPTPTPLVSLMVSFAAFAAGYLARPIGGIVLSHFGDRYGRRHARMAHRVRAGWTRRPVEFRAAAFARGVAGICAHEAAGVAPAVSGSTARPSGARRRGDLRPCGHCGLQRPVLRAHAGVHVWRPSLRSTPGRRLPNRRRRRARVWNSGRGTPREPPEPAPAAARGRARARRTGVSVLHRARRSEHEPDGADPARRRHLHPRQRH